jgi:hypothetical protein
MFIDNEAKRKDKTAHATQHLHSNAARGSSMRNSVWATALAAAVCVSATFAPSTAGAVGIYNGNGGVLYLDWLNMEDCNAFTAGTSFVCFALTTAGGGGSGKTGPVLHRANGEANLVVNGKPGPVVVATGASDKALQDLVRQGKAKKDAAAFQKAFDAAYASGSRKVNDAVANALSQQFKARIEEKR